MKKRVHPIYILESIYKQLFLLLIPLLRGLLTVFTADSLTEWLIGWAVSYTHLRAHET